NPSLKFLDITKINDYDKLEMLFFEILAKRPSERIHEEFDYIPYLNSSLFEIHENETKYLTISNLSDDAKISYHQKTVIKDEYGKKKLGQVSTLAYLFEFLDSYDFGSTTTEEIVNVQKSLINASVLGLIFEKINGYKDGSFYTPSFITMYMVRESIQKTVIEKLNRTFEIEASSFDELINYCNKHNYKNDFIAKASYAINSITICDPAVGSGHFLVSALNELIYIKYQLGLFSIKGLHMSLANDELLIKLENEWFEYTKPQDFDSLNHKLQKLLFEEKQKIIENQLFGVDINPNSSQITKLRLWIELLKNSYYDENYQLVTLPNIDINIKTGNSLISRFELQDKLKINNITEEIKNYKQRVSDYKNNLGTKKEVLESIASLKDKFKLSLKAEAKIQKEFDEKLKNYYREFGFDGLDSTLILRCLEWRNQQFQPALFGDKDTNKQYKLLGEITKLQSQIDEIEQGKIYEDAFEWRFEFPEVLDSDGDFVGFDIMIGNPPYIDSEAMTKQMPKEREYYSSNFETAKGNWDLYIVFLELSLKLGCDKSFSTFIIPNKVLSSQYGEIFRAKVVKDNLLFEICDVSQAYVFEEADVYPIILSLHATQKTKVTNDIIKFKYKITESKYINWAYYLEENIELYEKIKQIFNNIKNTKEILTASSATVAEAYELAEVLKDDKTQEIKVINTGTIDPYISLWGIQPMQYIKKKYLYPTIMKSQLKHKDWTLKPKIIIAGMGLRIEAFLDELGIVLPAKSTVVVYSEIINLKFLLALLNSSLYSFLFKIENKFTGMAGGYMNFNQNNISKLPFVISENQSIFIELVDQILEAKKQDPKADTSELERQIDMMVYELYGLSDDEIAVIEGKQ
ncbi:MAG: Eco57I restriction-modification methylase domain-containing protein, partial [Epsilonproteobacteria bacterium]|nr:Eco57I restriction-modification methylase domain-containing protein [Campylobacterota bacterium]